MRDYRKAYRRHYGIEFGPEYHVHHIDGDRKNNDIDNLILLPRTLHKKLHHVQSDVTMAAQYSLSVFNASSCGINHFFFAKEIIENCDATVKEVKDWVMRKFEADHGGGGYGDFPRY